VAATLEVVDASVAVGAAVAATVVGSADEVGADDVELLHDAVTNASAQSEVMRWNWRVLTRRSYSRARVPSMARPLRRL
jgi:hypothetical protein